MANYYQRGALVAPNYRGLSDLSSGLDHFYQKGSPLTVSGGRVTSWFVETIMDLVHIALLLGGLLSILRAFAIL